MAVFDALSFFHFQLPPPPQAQQNGQVVQPAQPMQAHLQQGQAVNGAPPPGFQPHLMGGQAVNAYPPPQQYYPQQNGYHPQHPQQPQHTTVVVNQHHVVPQQTRSSDDGFATGTKIFIIFKYTISMIMVL